MECPCSAHGLHVDCRSYSHGVLMECSWTAHTAHGVHRKVWGSVKYSRGFMIMDGKLYYCLGGILLIFSASVFAKADPLGNQVAQDIPLRHMMLPFVNSRTAMGA